MNKRASYALLSGIIPVFVSCSTWKNSRSESAEPNSPLTIVQGENRVEILNCDTVISLKKASFELEFNSLKYDSENDAFNATRIAATTDKQEFDKLEIGPLEKDHPFFGYATGMAPDDESGYHSMIIKDDGHHYIFYTSEDDKRATLIKEINNKTVRLRWAVPSFFINGETIPVESTELDQFYLMYLKDLNLNDTIDAGELSKIQINLN